NDTTQSTLALYALRQQDVSFALDDPITTWAETGIQLKGIWSHARGVTDSGRPAVDQLYTIATAPALGAKTMYVETSPYIRFRLSGQNRSLRQTEFKVSYSFYHDVDNTGFSFRRLRAIARTEQDIRVPVMTSSSNRSMTRFGRFLNLACPNIRSQ